MEKSIKLKNLKEEIKAGKIFVYPTDTIYGLGCDATNIEAVNKIKEIKKRDRDKPLSVIAPSIEWVSENLIIDVKLEDYLPGPYTILLKKKNREFLSHISSNEMIGVRIPKHPLTKEIQKSGLPFITTSINSSGEPFLVNLKELNPEIINKVDYILESKINLNGKPSTLIIGGNRIERT